jgi:hypothetical protein
MPMVRWSKKGYVSRNINNLWTHVTLQNDNNLNRRVEIIEK